MSDNAGLTEKFHVERLTPSGRGIDHADCRYFVLDPQHDPVALSALAKYAIGARARGDARLAADLNQWVRDLLPEPVVVDSFCPFHGSRPTAYDFCSCRTDEVAEGDYVECWHIWLDRPESDTRVCTVCGVEK